MCKQKILGLDLGSNSIGWALLEGEDGIPQGIIDAGCRIFNKAVDEGKTPTPKNAHRRAKRLARRVLERRARRKKRMVNYLIKLGLLPEDLKDNPQPEIFLNGLGNPYHLRAKALDHELTEYELGRVLLHLVQRRGFLSSKKTLLGDMIDDPDVLAILDEDETTTEDNNSEREKEETAFKKDISWVRELIEQAGCRTLGEYLAGLSHHECKRNRSREGGHLRTDRQMYKDELNLIWKEQSRYHAVLDNKVKEQIEHIIFHQRPLRLKAGRQGNCSLEPQKKCARMGRLEVQYFRYLQDINHLEYLEPGRNEWLRVNQAGRQALIELFDRTPSPTFAKIKTALGLHRKTEFNLETDSKKLKGNITACKIRQQIAEWDDWPRDRQYAFVEDIITINKKSILKKRLINHWGFDPKTAINICMIELEPGHARLSSKAIKNILPFLEKGQIYSEARINAGYGYGPKDVDPVDRLGPPPDIPNPIVSKGLHELRRIVNAVIAHHGKPDIIRIEMARDLEMNTERYRRFLKQQKKNQQANDEATGIYHEMREKNPHLRLSAYPGRDDKLRYRLWKDQDERCAYSNERIPLATLFSAEVEIDHIIPYSQSLDDSYMNKVVCLAQKNRYKGQRTPIDAFGGNNDLWEQITRAIGKWGKQMRPKKDRFYKTSDEIQERDFISTQLNDTRYICREALTYLKQIGSDVTATKGFIVSLLRRQWGLDTLIGETDKKDRTDHRHHTIDAIVIASIDRSFHKRMVSAAKNAEKRVLGMKTRDLSINPPWKTLREDAQSAINQIIVSHSPLKKLSGALHEDTGAGFIEGVGTVYRKDLNGDFKPKQVKKIIDKDVAEIVQQHLAKYDNNPKTAFAEGVKVYHKDGKTPIKRVRMKQSETTAQRLAQNKFGVKNRQGNIFKWMTYGNIHHVEIIQDIETGNHSGVFVTMMEAHRRAMTGTKSANKRGVEAEPIVRQDHGKTNQFIMALHRYDIVSLIKNNQRKFFRIQKLEPLNKRVKLRLHNASTETNQNETLSDGESTIASLMDCGLTLHKFNVLGKELDD